MRGINARARCALAAGVVISGGLVTGPAARAAGQNPDCPGATSSTSGECVYSTPGTYTFVVPAGVASIGVSAIGAAGGTGYHSSDVGGSGAQVSDDAVPVSAGTQLQIVVGGVGADGTATAGGGGGRPGSGGNAGNVGGGAAGGGGGGGGFSGVIANTSLPLLIAAGGGGSGGSGLGPGGSGDTGAGGGRGSAGSDPVESGDPTPSDGGGGTGAFSQSATSCTQGTGSPGGNHGDTGRPGLVYTGGDGGLANNSGPINWDNASGGGGGGGACGGGGGGADYWADGGGGGSSFDAGSDVVETTTGLAASVQIQFVDSTPPTGPTATIDAPAANSRFQFGVPVSTHFTCDEGFNGPGLASCDDSDGNGVTAGGAQEASGAGTLDTGSVGTFTYSVTATSTDGQVGTASLSYRVTRAQTATALSCTHVSGRHGTVSPCTVTVRATATAEAFAPTGRVDLYSTNGGLNVGSCGLSPGSGVSSSCSFTAAPQGKGQTQLFAGYAGTAEFNISRRALTITRW